METEGDTKRQTDGAVGEEKETEVSDRDRLIKRVRENAIEEIMG